jgi:exodeoxyribonuclease VII large subunit
MNNDVNKYLTVSALTGYLKYKFDTDEHLKCVFLKGEISNFKSHTAGHLYFSIKDEKSKINAIMFGTNAKKINFTPMDGTKVLLIGRVSVYEATGNYQIYVDEMMEDGVGNLYVAYEKLKADLAKEGLFDESHKKAIPKFPKRVGVITAATGAAIRDIISTIERRYPVCEIILFPSLVQGDNAAPDIVKNIKRAENYDLDVLIVGRGGGSIEDLWAFNEEIVARAIYNCSIPTISAVGHEVDFTIADFVADHRAPTPTGAAEIAVPNIIEVQSTLNSLSIRLKENIIKKINYNKLLLDSYKNSFIIKNPVIMYENKKILLDQYQEKITFLLNYKLELRKNNLTHLLEKIRYVSPKEICVNKRKDLIIIDTKLNSLINYKLENTKNIMKHLIDKLELVSPLNVLKRGYSITYKNDKPVNTIKDIKISDKLNLRLHNGSALVEVKEIMEDK